MKLISWNVNGIRACLTKGFLDYIAAINPDIICLQEVKARLEQVNIDIPGYSLVWHSAEKPGYSGTAVFSRIEPISVQFDLARPDHPLEGRVIIAEFYDFFLVNCYTPNSQNELRRLDYRMGWEDDFRLRLLELDAVKPVVLCGDLNVAHREIDLKNPKSNRHNAGFTDEERQKLTILLDSGFVDTFRHFYPDLTGAYTWWSYIGGARSRNAGWRIDYFLVSERFLPRVLDAFILPEVMGSDHCPVGIDIV